MQPVLVPFLNPNETEVLLADVYVAEGAHISAGAAIAALETTKSSAELISEHSGYVIGLRFSAGQTVRSGDILCYLAESANEIPPQQPAPKPTTATATEPPAGVRITQPALALAHQLGLDITQLPTGTLITEAAIRSLTAASSAPVDPTALIIYGGGGHGKTLIEMVRAIGGYRLVGLVDDGIPAGSSVLGVPVLGGAEVLPQLVQQGVRLAVNAVGGIGNLAARIAVFERLARHGFTCPNLIHPQAVVESSVELTGGTQVFALAYVGSSSHVGFGCIVNTGAIVSHDCTLGSYTNLSPGAILAGAVQVGERSLVGMGATVNLEVKIGAGARIGNGATVKADVPAGSVVRAGAIWPT